MGNHFATIIGKNGRRGVQSASKLAAPPPPVAGDGGGGYSDDEFDFDDELDLPE